jgi:hypothetical protein
MDKKIIFLFNRTTIDLLKLLKNQNDYLKKQIKKHYRVYDKTNITYITDFLEHFSPYHDDIVNETLNEKSTLEILSNVDILNGIKVKHILDLNDKQFDLYIYTLYLYALFYQYYKDEVEDLNILLEKTVRVLFNLGENNVEDFLEEIIDDDILTILKKIIQCNKQNTKQSKELISSNIQQQLPDNDLFSTLLGNSKLVSIAKEICDEIINDKSFDISELQNTKGDISDLQQLLSSNNNIIGNLIEKVGTSISSKMTSGDIDQEELMTDAFSMLSKLNGSKDLENLMSSIASEIPNVMNNNNFTPPPKK